MAWDVRYRKGVWLPQIDWWLDARFAVDRAFVSHAHSDHIAGHRRVTCTAATARFLRERLPAARTSHVLAFGRPEALTAETEITLCPAGHILGSAQCLLRHEREGSLLYTGDFKLKPGLAAEPCATPRADVLVMETTFGRPRYVFPPASEVLTAIAAFCHEAIADGRLPLLFAYSLGKSQEVLRGLAGAGLPIMLHPRTERLTRIYRECGMDFPEHRPFVPEEARGHVVICPPQAAGSGFMARLGPCRTAILTGWAVEPGARYRYRCDAAFPLSDHADYPDLLRFVERVGPRLVLTLHGFAADFARDLRSRGVDAWALGVDNQLEFGFGP
ncbi:MAG: MBL fold metallo-hydrolase RNA specificity domain-containing protein [Opitutaceae bacterium]